VEEKNIWASIAFLALVGGVLTALLYTERGRQSLRRLEHSLDDFGNSLQELRGALQKAGAVAAQGIDVASEGMEVVSNLIGKSERKQEGKTLH
jgi:hypothetical protein